MNIKSNSRGKSVLLKYHIIQIDSRLIMHQQACKYVGPLMPLYKTISIPSTLNGHKKTNFKAKKINFIISCIYTDVVFVDKCFYGVGREKTLQLTGGYSKHHSAP